MRRYGLAVAVAICLAAFAAQGALAYTDEGAMVATTNYTDRSAFIIDQLPVVNNPPGFIPGSVFLSQPYLSYYEQYGFDRNFFTWNDPTGSFTPNKRIQWSGCQPVTQGVPTHQTKEPDGRLLCDPNFTIPDNQNTTIRSIVATGPVHGFVFVDSNGVIHFVSTVCGNFTHPGPAPPPTITGVKFNDLNDNGTRDTDINGNLEPGLAGFVFDLFYKNQPVLDSHGNQVKATSDANGNYTFTLDADTLTAGGVPIGPGEYEIKEEQQAGWTTTTPQPVIVNIPVQSAGQNYQAADTGNFKTPTPPSITTQLVPAGPVEVGTAVHDTAQLFNVTSDAGGTVKYTSYPSLNDCVNGTNGTGAGNKIVTNGVVPKSNNIKYQTTGTFYWQAVYSGDANNKGASSNCADEAITVTPPHGMLVICKASTNGTSGSSFLFNVTDSGGALHPVTVGGGTCSDPLTLPTGSTTIQEDLSSGLWVVTEIDVSPTANLVGTPDLQHGSVAITLNDNETTTVTFTNKKAPPTLIVCKWTNAPTLLGHTFNFTAGQTALSAVAVASEADTSKCSNPVTGQVGQTITVTESIPSGVVVKSIDVSPNATLAGASGGVAQVTLGSGTNYVFYEDELAPPQTGFIEICKDAADQFVSTTTLFTFTIVDKTGVPITAQTLAGQCTAAIQVAAGTVTVTETIVPPNMLANVTTIPASALGLVNLINGSAVVVVPVSQTSNGEVQIHFLNTTQTASLKICKVLTSSSAALDGMTFPFDVIDAAGEQTVKVTALFRNGQCTIVPISLPVGSTVTATEPATQFIGANGQPANTAVTQTITIAPGINSITFTNQAFGQLEICKHLVGGDPDNGPTFTFDYAGVSSWNQAHGTIQVAAGRCSFPTVVPVDNYTIKEESTTGFSFQSATATGPLTDNRIVTAGNPFTVSVPYFNGALPNGGETEITVWNAGQTGTIKVCKVIDANSSASIGGYNYTFKVFNPDPNGNILLTSGVVQPPYPTTTNPNANAPNACVLLGSYSVGTPLLVQEVGRSGVQVEKITLNGNATINSLNTSTGKIKFTVTGPGNIVIIFTNESS